MTEQEIINAALAHGIDVKTVPVVDKTLELRVMK